MKSATLRLENYSPPVIRGLHIRQYSDLFTVVKCILGLKLFIGV